MTQGTALAIIKAIKPPANLKTLGSALAKAKTPEAVLDFERRVEAYESYMRKAGFSQGDIHELNEHRMRARWRLGQMLSAVSSKRGGSKLRGAPLKEMLQRLGLEKTRALEAQRIGCLPKIELEKIFQGARRAGDYVTTTGLVDAARPYWYKASREARHKKIREAAAEKAAVDILGPFPLLYADPPWKFDVYSEKGLERTPDQKFPTLTDEEIKAFKVNGKPISDITHKDAALLLWCTSSNVMRAKEILVAWGFEFKSSAVWVKADKQPEDAEDLSRSPGTGLVFRNMHEILLYGTRGKMPGPRYLPPSVFFYPRGKIHSAKPPEIRQVIDKMYPDFGASTRLELFSRGQHDGWTSYGFEA